MVLGNPIDVRLLHPPVSDGLTKTCGRHSRGPRPNLSWAGCLTLVYAATPPRAGAAVKPKLKLIPVFLALVCCVRLFYVGVAPRLAVRGSSCPVEACSSPCDPWSRQGGIVQQNRWSERGLANQIRAPALEPCASSVGPYTISMASPKL